VVGPEDVSSEVYGLEDAFEMKEIRDNTDLIRHLLFMP
jgi:hypothetical protein